MRNPSAFLRVSGLVIFGLLLGACASTDPKPKLVRTTTVDFESSFNDMTFKVLPADEQVRLGINVDDPRFKFEGGISHFEALTLPDLAQPYYLQIDSEVVKNRLGYTGTIFYPVLTFLDANKEWLKTFDALPYVVQKPYGKVNYMTVTLQMSDELATARYLVIHTQDDRLNKAIGVYEGEQLLLSSGFNTMMTSPVDKPRLRYEFAAHGWVRLTASAERKLDAKSAVEY